MNTQFNLDLLDSQVGGFGNRTTMKKARHVLPQDWGDQDLGIQALPADGDDRIANLKKLVHEILTADELSLPAARNMVAMMVVKALEEVGGFYHMAGLPQFSTALYRNSQLKRIQRIRSDTFSAWISAVTGINRADDLFEFVIKGIETAALESKHAQSVVPARYWDSRPDAIYISNGDWEMVKVSVSGVEMVENGTDDVLFAPNATLLPWKLVEPTDPFETCSLFRDGQYEDEHAVALLKVWFLSLPTSVPCKPVLTLTGEIRGGKTRLAKGFQELIGMPPAALNLDECRKQDVWLTLNRGGIAMFDNADTRIKWFPDLLAAASTAGSVQKRQLYTDDTIVQLDSNAWPIVTSANPYFGRDPGLADRLLVVRMRQREGPTDDMKLSDEIAANRDGALTFLAAALSLALADTAPTPDNLNARHPDFAAFAVKLGRAVGSEAEVIKALTAAEKDKSRFCLETDSVGAVLMAEVAQDGICSGTAADLVLNLALRDKQLAIWLTAQTLSKKLKSLWPHIQSVFNASKRIVHGGVLEYVIESKGDLSAPPPPPQEYPPSEADSPGGPYKYRHDGALPIPDDM
ncbi:MAG: hypothetical protein ACYC23_06960 [Limisphaerales bacterium]